MGRTRFGRQRGQILPLFVLSLGVIIAMAALLYDGAGALATRRRFQNASDAAALAGANVIQATGSIRACSATAGPPPGAARADVTAAILASIDRNLPGFDHTKVVITCPSAWGNQAVSVSLAGHAPSFFGGAVIGGALGVRTTSTAMNGRTATTNYSVIELDPWNNSWPSGRRGCPSLLLSGGPTVVFDGSVQVDSACPAANGGALSTNGNASSLTVNNGAKIQLVGGYSPGPLTITPTPLTGQPYVPDPLADIDSVSRSGLTVRSSSKLILNNSTQVLSPGIYTGGIQLKNSSIAYLKPGIYYLNGGGLDLGAQSSMFAINPGLTSTSAAAWAADCGDTTCGVMIFNAGTASGSGAMGPISVGAGATLKLRAYDDRANGNAFPDYRNILVFQDRTPAQSSGYGQPIVTLSGGGQVDISGTVYAPNAAVKMGGSSGGSGGNVNLTLQFISWDLEMSGNVSFRFYFSGQDFARSLDYGLVN